MLQVAAEQEYGLKARDEIVSRALSALTGKPLPQETVSTRPASRAASQDITADHMSEHAEALQTLSRSSSEHSLHEYVLQDDASDTALQETHINGNHQAAGPAEGKQAPQKQKQKGRWPWAKSGLGKGSPRAAELPELGSPVPSETAMCQRPPAHLSGTPRAGSSNGPEADAASQERPSSSARWDCMLGTPAADAFDSGPEAAEDAPLLAVVEALVLRRALAQYACTARACLGCAFIQSCTVLLIFGSQSPPFPCSGTYSSPQNCRGMPISSEVLLSFWGLFVRLYIL